MSEHAAQGGPQTVLVEVRDQVATITLNAPDRLNAVDADMLEALTRAVRDSDADPQVRLIVLTGAGRGFCSGASLAPDSGVEEVPTDTLTAITGLIHALTRSQTLTVALVNGVAAGVGCSIAIACHYVLARESASFMLAFTKIGLMPDGASTALVAASVGRARAQRMALTAEKVPAATAFDWGLIAEVAADDAYEQRAADLVATFARGATRALSTTASAINEATLTELDAALHREVHGQTALFHTADFVEGAASFREKRAAVFTGS